MKKLKKMGKVLIIITVLSAIISMFASPIFAEEYKVIVRRIDSNLYQDQNSRVIIKTSLCLELALAEEAILIWDGINHFACGKLIFIDAGTSCQVDGVYK